MARDAERLARFQREAEVLASLNHLHIAQIYGLEEVFTLGHPAEDKRGIYVASMTNREQPKRLLPDASPVTYVPSSSDSSGSLLFARGGAVITQPFNPESLELTGEPHRVIESVRGFSASTTGSIVYRAAGSGRRLTWLDRQGNVVASPRAGRN